MLASWLSHASAHCLRFSSKSAALRLYSTTPEQNIVAPLVREFLHDSLYHETEGYFARQEAPVGSLLQPLPFCQMHGQRDVQLALRQRYDELQVAWLTPSEIFSPHYGRAIAAYILQTQQKSQQTQPLRISEIGGGTGTLAADIMDYLRDSHTSVYERCQYTCIEISPQLAALQYERVAEQHAHGERFAVEQRDAANLGSWGQPQADHTFVVMAEVLDNLPHDRVWRSHEDADWCQTRVMRDSEALTGALGVAHGLSEVTEPVTDELISECLAALHWESEQHPAWRRWLDIAVGAGELGEAAFLPTGALRLFKTLHAALPNHVLIAADFDELPDVRVQGLNAPLVASTERGSTVDFGSYLVPRGAADVFFPSDFSMLARLYKGAAQGGAQTVSVQKSSRFLEAYADLAATRTISGYNPLIEDFLNTSVLCATTRNSD